MAGYSIAWSMHVEYLAFVALVAAYVTGWAVWILTRPDVRRRRRIARRRRQIRRRDDRLARNTRCDLSRLDRLDGRRNPTTNTQETP